MRKRLVDSRDKPSKHHNMVPLLLLALLPVLVTTAPARRHMIDMTHALIDNGKMPSYPGHTPYNFTINVRGPYKLLNNVNVELNTILLSEHTATHIDAPSHVGGKSRVHQIPDQDLIGPGVVIDISEKAKMDKDAELLLEDVLKYEETYGRIPNRAFVFCNSGWEKYWMDKKAFLGTDQWNIVSELHSPGFSLEATKWLVEQRYIIGIGTDTVSFEKTHTKTLPVHRYLLGEKNRVGFEMVANLSRVPPAGATVYAFPMKIYDGSGAPVRMFAILNGGFGLVASRLTASLMSIMVLYWFYLF
ncbi:isatin hydrolase-like [Lineus longissimus]|uniref:isatin hydrolase-like n=1 Tax=Lineus longissimus TaxID=88925 RepID=UPI002B4DE946